MEYSKLKWFFFVIIIPLIFALVVYSVIISFMGKSVVDQVKSVGSHIPFVSSLLEDEKKAEPNSENNEETLQKEITRLTETLNAQEQDVIALEKKLLEKDEDLVKAKETIVKLEKQLENASETGVIVNQNVKETAKMLLAMSPKDAASIITEMQNNEVIPVLNEMKANESGRILAKLDPKRASDLMKELLAES